MIPLFTAAAVGKRIADFTNQKEIEIIKAYAMIGEKFVNDARLFGPYLDDTSNLRSSIGYIVAFDGDIKIGNFKTIKGGQAGMKEAQEFASELLKQFKKGIVLIVVAGMDYAAAVEEKGYSVLTDSVPLQREMKEAFDFFNL